MSLNGAKDIRNFDALERALERAIDKTDWSELIAVCNAQPESPLVAIDHHVMGVEKWFDTPEEAQVEFARQFAQIPIQAGQYLFIRHPPALIEEPQFEGGGRYRMVARFSVMEMK